MKRRPVFGPISFALGSLLLAGAATRAADATGKSDYPAGDAPGKSARIESIRVHEPVKPAVSPDGDAKAQVNPAKRKSAMRDLHVCEPRPPKNPEDLRYWLEDMFWYHRYSPAEISAATGLPASRITTELKRLNITSANRPHRLSGSPLTVRPYPGGPHPRIGFLEGAVNPQRDTKISVFAPWDESSYAVVDLPEAIWSNLGLTYLAHTHIPTLWTEHGILLVKTEWQPHSDGSWTTVRMLPNGIEFGTKVIPGAEGIQMSLWLTNHSDGALSDLRIQNCVMLKNLRGFASQTNDNKVFDSPFVACHSADGKRWIITAWDRCFHAWGNAPVPCLHSDPKFPDCARGKTVRLRGWLSFYEGTDIQHEVDRLKDSLHFTALEDPAAPN